MSKTTVGILAAVILGGGFALSHAQTDRPRTLPSPTVSPRTGGAPSAAATNVDQLIRDWPDTPREVAQKMIQKYGPPHEATASKLVWHKTGPWKRTILSREEVKHNWPKPHTDVLEQVIDYRVPPDKFDDLAKYDGSVIAERTKGELSARCDKEEMNFLALNLANDVVTGKRSIEEARSFYTQTAVAAMKGETPEYVQGFRFQLPKGDTADPDKPAMKDMAKAMVRPSPQTR